MSVIPPEALGPLIFCGGASAFIFALAIVLSDKQWVALGWLWALPTTLLGVLLGLLGGARPAHVSGPECAWVWHVEGGFLGWLWPRMKNVGPRGVGAWTCGAVIMTMPACDPALLTHERTHVRQGFVLGALYLPVYLVSWLVAGCSYRDNWMEAQARKAAGEE